MFALVAALIAILALLGIGTHWLMLWLFLACIALHYAFGWGPINQPWTRRTTP